MQPATAIEIFLCGSGANGVSELGDEEWWWRRKGGRGVIRMSAI